MKIVRFRIFNYKSIIDSGDCYPSDGVTILAGKNEAGKSSILEALEDFNFEKVIRRPLGRLLFLPISRSTNRQLKNVARMIVCKAHGTQEPECTHVHEDSEYRATPQTVTAVVLRLPVSQPISWRSGTSSARRRSLANRLDTKSSALHGTHAQDAAS